MYSSTMTGYRFIVSNNAVQQVQNNTRICLNTAAVCNGTASLGPHRNFLEWYSWQ